MFGHIDCHGLSWFVMVTVQVCQQIDGACYDLGYDTQTVRNMSRISQFPSVSAKILQAVKLKTQLDAVDSRRETPSANPADLHSAQSVNTAISDTILKPKVFD